MNTLIDFRGGFAGRAIAFVLETALAASDWITKHGYPGLAWPVIIFIVAATGFGITALGAAAVGMLFGCNSHWMLFGLVGALSLTIFLAYRFFQVAGH